MCIAEQSSEPGENREQKRDYHCEVCNEVFTSKRWLTSHRINHVMGMSCTIPLCASGPALVPHVNFGNVSKLRLRTKWSFWCSRLQFSWKLFLFQSVVTETTNLWSVQWTYLTNRWVILFSTKFSHLAHKGAMRLFLQAANKYLRRFVQNCV